MQEQERPLMDRVWEFTKDLSVKFSRKAEKHWRINTLRVEIASIRHRINGKYKDLGRYVYQSLRSQTLEEDSYKATLREFFEDIQTLEAEVLERENRIELLEMEMRESQDSKASERSAENSNPAAATQNEPFATPPVPPAPIPDHTQPDRDEDEDEEDHDKSPARGEASEDDDDSKLELPPPTRPPKPNPDDDKDSGV